MSHLALEFFGILNVDQEPAICVDGMVACALPVPLVITHDANANNFMLQKLFTHEPVYDPLGEDIKKLFIP